MSFSKNLTITVKNTNAKLNEPLYVYEKDRNLIMYFRIMDYKYKFDKNPTNMLASVDDIMDAYATIVDPNGYELTRQNGEVIDDEIKFVLTDDLIDEIDEIGTYRLQFHIKCEHSEFTIPEISFEVLERLKGRKTVTDESEVGDIIVNNSESFIDEEGKLQIVWQKGDTISSVRLNQMVEVVNNAVDEEHLRKLNEQERVNAENIRVANETARMNEEATRVANENTRTANENIRIANEDTRVVNENARINDENKRQSQESARQYKETERQTNEQTRVQNEEDRVTNENARAANEDTRVANENARKDNESERKANEALRQSNENKRQTNEQTRIQNEENRVTAENVRVASEDDRLANENVRVFNENERKANETLRQSKENERQTNEQARTAAENDRANNEQERIQNENARVSKEDERIANENARSANENARVTSESARSTNENARINNENERKAKETLRQSQESTRQSQESTRQSQESVRQTNEQTRIQNEKNRVTAENARVTSMNNIVTRFNALTVSQQQDAEVIDARDNEVSLKARLDRDIEKAKQVYVNVEGSNISTDSSVGYAKDVEILGNTIQDTSNLADIRSVGDTVEGQELYEIPVVSVGKNLVDNSKRYIIDMGHPSHRYLTINNGGYTSSSAIFYLKQGNYSFSVEGFNMSGTDCALFVWKKDKIHSNARRLPIASPFTIEEDEIGITFYLSTSTVQEATSLLNKPFMIEEGTVATPYEPYQEDKLTILSPVQLEKVGDVADRIIEKDGVWGVEKNVETVVLNGSENWDYDTFTKGYYTALPNLIANATIAITNRYLGVLIIKGTGQCHLDGPTGDKNGNLVINHDDGVIGTTAFREYVTSNNITVKYPTTSPQFIPLPHDQQVKLRTFANKTNISFLTEIEGTIKAQVPKSLGATVNTHTEQISNLNKELDRVKKLEESTVSTVETESDFITVEATSNGYFEDVKLEGKTLVNLINYSNKSLEGSKWNNFVKIDCLNSMLKQSTEYTIIAYVEGLSADKSFTINSNDGYGLFTAFDVYIDQNGMIVFKVISKSDFTDMTDVLFTAHNPTNNIGIFTLSLCILEGDHTQNPPSYFEGLKSAGQNVDEVSVNSVKGNSNLVDAKILTENVDDSFIILNYNTNTIKPKGTSWPFIHIPAYKKGKKYRLKMDISIPTKDNGLAFNLATTKSNYPNDKYGNIYANSNCPESINMIIDGNGTGYWLRGNSHNIYSNISLTFENVDIQEFSTLKQDKKRLLYYNNETQSWEKPILREWDSIEKHADGIYYYHQRSGERVLNGSENWSQYNSLGACTPYLVAIPEIKYNHAPISDKFIGSIFDGIDEEKISVGGTSHIIIKKANSTLSTQDVAGFKQWLQANNVTVVYQLAEEKVYECTNIDLITYTNETNYVVNCGAIVPKTTLKVHNNISNVVSLLQKKVSILETKFIAMFKAVLSGDYQTLAYSLYPEDFENTNTDVNE